MLEFNKRVLAMAEDESIPLLERLRFLCITCTNLDEFFEIRVAGLKQKAELGAVQAGPDNMTPQETLKAISRAAHELVDEQYRVFDDALSVAPWNDSLRARIYAQYAYIAETRHPSQRLPYQQKAQSLYPAPENTALP